MVRQAGDQDTVLDIVQDVTFQCCDGFWKCGVKHWKDMKSDHLEKGRELMQKHSCR